MIGRWELGAMVVTALLIRPWRVRPRSLRELSHRRRGGAAGDGNGGDRMAGADVSKGRGRRRRDRRRRRRVEAEVVRRLPETVDLLVLGVGAGLTPRIALARASPFVPEPFGSVIESALARAGAGAPFAEALERGTAALGPFVRPLVTALVAGEHDGVALVPALLRVGDEARRRRRTMAEERARRLPVTMLAPLVVCVLPAFVLLTIAPLVLTALADLEVT